MALTTAGVQVGAAAIAADINGLSLHSANPGTTGASQVGTKQAVTCTATNGVVTAPSTAFTGLPASGPVTYAGVWSGATFRGGFVLTGDQTANAAGEYTVDSVTITGTAS
jgi:hypothetical protein